MGGGDGKGGRRERHAFKLLAPDELIARILGSKGARKQQIESETGTRIFISGRDEFFPNTRFRIIIIYSDAPDGALGAIDRLLQDIEVCASKEALPPSGSEGEFLGLERGQFVLRAAVSRNMGSAIIGTKGSHVKAIREECGAKVAIDASVVAGHQLVKLIAEPNGLRAAVARINRCVQDEVGKESYDEWYAMKTFSNAGSGAASAAQPPQGGKGASDRARERERSPRRAPPRERSPPRRAPPPVVLQPEDDTEVDPSLLQALTATAEEFPPGTLEMEHAITCELPKEKVTLLIGRKGEDIQKIRKATGTWIHFDPAEEGTDGQMLTIKGPLLRTYRAHALLMRRYHETNQEESADRRQGQEEEGADRRHGKADDSMPASKVRDLEEQLQSLQRQLASQTQQSTGGGGGGSRKGGKGDKGHGKGSRKKR
eukprot:TRINITY_DN60624_c0_g1_i1.p1 TRINITY_DN60624_c0_g1~~TRINITY_DN60624_c0_g1_i1.p1  ORF type:complete len:429 (-),score=86.35 TRINITY_DN60624_c0_g1_i1:43-1329(-)